MLRKMNQELFDDLFEHIIKTVRGIISIPRLGILDNIDSEVTKNNQVYGPIKFTKNFLYNPKFIFILKRVDTLVSTCSVLFELVGGHWISRVRTTEDYDNFPEE